MIDHADVCTAFWEVCFVNCGKNGLKRVGVKVGGGWRKNRQRMNRVGRGYLFSIVTLCLIAPGRYFARWDCGVDVRFSERRSSKIDKTESCNLMEVETRVKSKADEINGISVEENADENRFFERSFPPSSTIFNRFFRLVRQLRVSEFS